ncbi:MAG: globin family protein [Pseudomonadota bacterium]
MTDDDITLVQGDFAIVKTIDEQAAALFYGRLFEIAPEVKPLFSGDMAEQGKKLMTTLGVVVNALRDLDSVMPAVVKLAQDHVGYGVKPAHYDQVGAALLWTLEQGLGDAFTPDHHDAWARTYGTLSGAMISVAYPDATAAQ